MEQDNRPKYSVRDWKTYNQSLINRGNIALWFCPEELSKKWFSHEVPSVKGGRPYVYSREAIQLALTVRFFFRLPLRMTEGFLMAIFKMLTIDLPIPSYQQIAKRTKKVKLPKLSTKRPTDIVVDGSGVKVYGEGEWKVKQHGKGKRRKWKKFHVSFDPKTQEAIVVEVTDGNTHDNKILPQLLDKTPKRYKRVIGDGAFDSWKSYALTSQYGAKLLTPPRKGSRRRISAPPERNKTISIIRSLGGDDVAREIWKKLEGYHLRSLVETFFSRFKRFFGGTIQSRLAETQQIEIGLKCLIMNRFAQLGLPNAYRT